jgi:hypothetical protein
LKRVNAVLLALRLHALHGGLRVQAGQARLIRHVSDPGRYCERVFYANDIREAPCVALHHVAFRTVSRGDMDIRNRSLAGVPREGTINPSPL